MSKERGTNRRARTRSEQMALVRSANTKPEIQVRSLVSKLGYRYVTNVDSLPGCPDVVVRKLRKAIFVHGCFWHQHRRKTCRLSRMPKSRVNFWRTKFEGNRVRDAKVRRSLRSIGWQVLVVWECDLPKVGKTAKRLQQFLDA